MIFDSLKHAKTYEDIHPKFKEAFAFIERAIAEGLPIGRYELDGDALYAMVQEYSTKPAELCTFEGHRKYIDIQYIIKGTECMDVGALETAVPSTEYDAQRDLMLYNPIPDANTLDVGEGEFALFFPHDIHRPGTAVGEPAFVGKIVVKVRV
jgi:YhcH/YjgK/YiaL family protein